jgi:hypothetical protein
MLLENLKQKKKEKMVTESENIIELYDGILKRDKSLNIKKTEPNINIE